MEKVKLLKELLASFINDVEKGVDPADAGWVQLSSAGVELLMATNTCERKEDKIRVAFRPLACEIVAKFNDKDKWLAEVHAEIIQAVNLIEEVTRTIKNGTLQPATIFLGWKSMLATSGFPVVVERILQEGFAPDNWSYEAEKASSHLSMLVVKKWWDEDRVKEGLRKLSIFDTVEHSINIGKVAKILKWDVVLEVVRKNEVIALGLLWFADSMIKNLSYMESLVYFQKGIWKTVEKITEENGAVLREKILHMVEEVERATSEKDKFGRSYPIACWNFIIRMPW